MANAFNLFFFLCLLRRSNATVVVSATNVYVEEGEETSYTVKLSSAPIGEAVVNVSSSNTSVVIAVPSALTFNASTWNIERRITIKSIEDDVSRGAEFVEELFNSVHGEMSTISVAVTIYDSTYCVRACDPGYYSTTCENHTQICLPCPSGSWCAGGCTAPSLCGPGTYASAIGSTNCTQCPSGEYTPKYGALSCELCPIGYSCEDPSQVSACPAGTISPTVGAVACQNCTSGYYTIQTGQHACLECPAGFECPDTASSPSPCDPGTYSIGNQSACTACPAGYACQSNGAAPIPCADGAFSLTNWQYCVLCPAGHYCLHSAQEPTVCPSGTMSQGSSSKCETCASGTYTGENVSGATSCTTCPRGFACYHADQDPVECTNGSYADEGQIACKSCPFGTTSGAAAYDCDLCPRGYECPSPDTLPSLCSEGYFSDTTGSLACQACAPGRITSSDRTRCIDCPAGFKCPDPADGPQPCENGFYSLNDTTIGCKVCPEGHACPVTDELPTACNTGFFAPVGSSNCTQCPEGSKCPDPRVAPEKCAIGNYSLAGATSCSDCLQGYTCIDGILGSVCDAGKYASADHTTCTACPAGSACEDGKIQISACPLGKYSTGNQSTCLDCPAGYFCPTPDLMPIPCPYATWSPGSSTNCSRCSPGRRPSADRSKCHDCAAGTYCPFLGQELEIDCPAGTYSTGGQRMCTPCPPGYECPTTTSDSSSLCEYGSFADGSAASCLDCPAGLECASTSNSQMSPCPLGTYSPLGVPTCLPCPQGSMCPSPETGIQPCDYGTYSLRNQSNCTVCPSGYECPSPDSEPIMCQEGFYSTGGATVCIECTPGYNCPNASTTSAPRGSECPVGFWCNPPGRIEPCPAGTFGNTTAGRSVDHACAPCLPGYSCPNDGTTFATMELCPSGFYCEERTVMPTACPAGTWSSRAGATSVSTCELCPGGHYCPQNTSNYLDKLCDWGSYCPTGSYFASMQRCPAGTYNDRSGMKSAADCKNCTIGSYCPEGSAGVSRCPVGTYNSLIRGVSLSNCRDCTQGFACDEIETWNPHRTPCASGHYCPPGTSYPNDYPCPAGTYTNFTNATSVNDCIECPAGYACGSGTTLPEIECSPGNYCEAGTSPDTMEPCPAGTYSPSTRLEAASDCTSCNASFFCSGGDTAVSGTCPLGRYCPEGSATGELCPAGTYGSTTGLKYAHECTTCPAGSFCKEGVSNPTLCPAGSFAPTSGTKDVGPLTSCTSKTMDCYDNAEECLECWSGYFCPEGATEGQPCGVGNHSSAGAMECSICEAGHFCGSNATTTDDMYSLGGNWNSADDFAGQCFNGTYCSRGMTRAPDLLRDACPTGFYCPTSTSLPISCPAGRYNPVTGADDINDCLYTPKGYYTIAGASNYTEQCSPGYYCPAGSTSAMEVPCPERFYLPDYGGGALSDCALCVSGGYCGSGRASPEICPQGYYCSTGVARPEPCRPGTYGNSTGLRRTEDCTSCPAGHYCDGYGLTAPRGLCDPGYYCYEKSWTSAPHAPGSTLSQLDEPSVIGGLCPAGGYCPLGSTAPKNCPNGTYNNYTGATSPDDCAPCTPGYYCAGSSNPYPSGPCDAGYYCLEGSDTPTQYRVPKGHFSISGASAPSPCVPGTYQPASGQSTCLECDPGKYCVNFNTSTQEDCIPGHYCEAGTVNPEKCPAGTFSDEYNLNSSIYCRKCDAGYYCDEVGITSADQKPCAASFWCGEGSYRERPIDQYNAEGELNGDICPAGYYCPYAGPTNPIPCPKGTYYPGEGHNASSSADACVPCAPGYACNSTGLAEPSGYCAEGYFCKIYAETATPESFGKYSGSCTENNWEDCDYGPCPKGYECAEGTGEPVLCQASTYAPNSSMATCEICPQGYYCDGLPGNTAQVFDCPLGRFCPEGTGVEPPRCLEGTYSQRLNLKSSEECLPCDTGRFCSQRGLLEPDGDCFEGFYCPLNSSSGRGFSGGVDHICPPGAYCPKKASTPTPCPNGTFSASEGLTNATGCANCTSGHYCSCIGGCSELSGPCLVGYWCGPGSSDPQQHQCPLGHRCQENASFPEPCPAGTYAPRQGLGECWPCPAGSFCEEETSVPTNCPSGFYCPNGTISAHEYPCPEGTYLDTPGGKSLLDCIDAPPGTYSLGVGNAQVDGLCRAGYYCSNGSTSATPTEASEGGSCGPGYSCTEGSTSMIDCPGGYYCVDGTGVTGLITAGYYSKRNSYTPTPDKIRDASEVLVADACPSGHFCVEGSAMPVPCPLGTFSTSRGNVNLTDCAPCLGGWLCPNNGTAVLSDKCPSGFYCPEGTVDTPITCPPGNSCLEGSAEPTPCAAGTYQNTTGQHNCRECPDGFYCLTESEQPVPCPTGMFCPNGTQFPTQFHCPRGSFSNRTGLADEDECNLCTSGQYCETTGLSRPTGDCAPGFFCQIGAKTATPRNDSDFLQYSS